MAGPLVVGAEDVLLIRDPDSYGASRPITEGLELVTQLRGFPTTRAMVLIGQHDTGPGEYFCKLHGLKHFAVEGITPEDTSMPTPEAQWHAIERIRARGPVNLVVTAYSEVFEQCLNTHQPVLLFGRRGALGTLEPTPSWADLHQRVQAHRDSVVELVSEDDADT